MKGDYAAPEYVHDLTAKLVSEFIGVRLHCIARLLPFSQDANELHVSPGKSNDCADQAASCYVDLSSAWHSLVAVELS